VIFLAKKIIKKNNSSKKLTNVCPNCFGENLIPRFGEGTDYWECKECGKNSYSILNLFGEELATVRAKHSEKLKQLGGSFGIDSPTPEGEQLTIERKVFWTRLVAVLLAILFVCLIIYSIIMVLK